MPLADQLAQIVKLKGQGQTSAQIAAAVGLEIGDVESVLGGALPAGISPGTPESLVAQTFSYAPEVAVPGTHQNAFADLAEAVNFVTVPALTFFLANVYAELSAAPEPGNNALPMAVALQLVGRPVTPPWSDAMGLGHGVSTDVPIVQSNDPAIPADGNHDPNTYYPIVAQTTIYVVQFPDPLKLTLQAQSSNAGNTIVAGSKIRNLKVTLVTMNPAVG
jgi:hypothetical protein